MAFQPQTFEEAKAAFKPLRRSRMPKQPDSLSGHGKTSPARGKSPRRASSAIPYGSNSLGARKKKPKKRAKVTTRKRLIKIIDNLVFQIVLIRDGGACVECGSKERPTTGHVLSRRSYSTRWDERNVHLQCWPDNYRAAMTAAGAYHLWFVKTFGVPAFDSLYQDWAKGRKYTRLELQNLVPEFELRLAELKQLNDL